MSTRAIHHQLSMPGGVVHARPIDGSSASPALIALEEKAGRLLKRCRYDEAAKTFQDVVDALLQLQHRDGEIQVAAGGGWGFATSDSVAREIGALEGLAICLSRKLK